MRVIKEKMAREAGSRSPQRALAIELRHVRYFLALSRELHFGRAAKQLNLAQPGLSQQISALEDLLGVLLFHRNRRKVELTVAGQEFALEAPKILAQTQRAVLIAQKAARGEVGRIEIGYVASTAFTGVLQKVVSSFRATHPQADLVLTEMEMQIQLQEMRAGRLDVSFIRPPVRLPPDIEVFQILDEPLVLLIGENHPLSRRKITSLAQLSDEIFITPRHPPGVSFYEYTVQACREAGFAPRLGPQGRDFVTIASMASVGLGVALAPSSLERVRLPGLVCKRIPNIEVTADLSFAYRSHEHSPATLAFVRHVRNTMKTQSAFRRLSRETRDES